MIAAAPAPTDPRPRAKRRLRAAARGTLTTPGKRPVRSRSVWRTLLADHPVATAATVLGLAAVVGPFRVARLALAAVRTASMAAGMAKLVSTLPPTSKGAR